MDELSKALFTAIPTSTLAPYCDEADSKQIYSSLFVEAATPDHIAAMVGAPGASQVVVAATTAPPMVSVHVTCEAPAVTMLRDFEPGPQGTLARHIAMVVEDGRHGVGTRLFARAVTRYRGENVERILVTATGAGAYVWPRLGFCMSLNISTQEMAERCGYPDVKSTHELLGSYAQEGAAEFWKEHCHSGTAEFLVAKDSAHNGLLTDYLAENNIDVG